MATFTTLDAHTHAPYLNTLSTLVALQKLQKLDVRGNKISDLRHTKGYLLKLPRLTSVAFQDIGGGNANPICKEKEYSQAVQSGARSLITLDDAR